MTLYLIGIGLCDERDISLKGLDAVKKCSAVYLENYTDVLQVGKEKLENLYEKPIVIAGRALVEDGKEILARAEREDVALLVVGDPMAATTHINLFLEARKRGIAVHVVHNASVFNAIGITGLQLYKFGKVTSIPFNDGRVVETPYSVIRENLHAGLHSLVLLDLDPAHEKFMTVNEGLRMLLEIGNGRNENIVTEKTLVVGVARLGSEDRIIHSGMVSEVMRFDFGKPPNCLVVPGKLHFMEEEMISFWAVK